MFQEMLGNATELDAKELQTELESMLVDGEQAVRGFKIMRDLFVFTDKRLILIDRGMTGKKTEYQSIPYKSITHFSVETAGKFDTDSEMRIYISGDAMPITRQFKKGTDIVGVQKTLAQYMLR